jgi:hypothetical protein
MEPAEITMDAADLAILAWPLSTMAATRACPPAPAGEILGRFRSQIDLTAIQRAAQELRQELERQQQQIATTRHQLPRGWCRTHRPTADLEILSTGPCAQPWIELPQIWP